MIFIYPAVVSDKIDERYLYAIVKTLQKYYLMHIMEAIRNGSIKLVIQEKQGLVTGDLSRSEVFIESAHGDYNDFLNNILMETAYINIDNPNSADFQALLNITDQAENYLDDIRQNGFGRNSERDLANIMKDYYDTFITGNNDFYNSITSNYLPGSVSRFDIDTTVNLLNRIINVIQGLHDLLQQNNLTRLANFATDTFNMVANPQRVINNINRVITYLNNLANTNLNVVDQQLSNDVIDLYHNRINIPQQNVLRTLSLDALNQYLDNLTNLSDRLDNIDRNSLSQDAQDSYNQLRTYIQQNIQHITNAIFYVISHNEQNRVSDRDLNSARYTFEDMETLNLVNERVRNMLQNLFDLKNRIDALQSANNITAQINFGPILTQLNNEYDRLQKALDRLVARHHQLEIARDALNLYQNSQDFLNNRNNLHIDNIDRINEIRNNIDQFILQNTANYRNYAQISGVNDHANIFRDLKNESNRAKNVLDDLQAERASTLSHIDIDDYMNLTPNQFEETEQGLQNINNIIANITEDIRTLTEMLSRRDISDIRKQEIRQNIKKLDIILGKLQERRDKISQILNSNNIYNICNADYLADQHSYLENLNSQDDIQRIREAIDNYNDRKRQLTELYNNPLYSDTQRQEITKFLKELDILIELANKKIDQIATRGVKERRHVYEEKILNIRKIKSDSEKLEQFRQLKDEIQTQIDNLQSLNDPRYNEDLNEYRKMIKYIETEISKISKVEKQREKLSQQSNVSLSMNMSEEFNILPEFTNVNDLPVTIRKSDGTETEERKTIPLGVKIVTIRMNSYNNIFQVLRNDVYHNYIVSHFIAFGRWFMKKVIKLPIINQLYMWYRKFKSGFTREHTDVYYDILLRDKKYVDASAFRRPGINKKGYQYYAASIVIMSDYDLTEEEQNFFEDPFKIKILFRMGWNSFVIMNDRIQKLLFCSVLDNGMCTKVPYSYLFKSSMKFFTKLESLKTYAGGIMANFKRIPYKDIKKHIER